MSHAALGDLEAALRLVQEAKETELRGSCDGLPSVAGAHRQVHACWACPSSAALASSAGLGPWP